MRYSIFEFSQEKLIEYGLDVTDALILNWFSQFYSCGMEKISLNDENDKTKFFGWVKISKVVEDIPVIGIATERGIRNRFDVFVEKGILERKTLSTHNGKKSYYRTTEIYNSLINKTAKEKGLQRNSTSYANEGLQGNSDSFATENNLQGNNSSFGQGKSRSYAQGNSSSFALNDSLTKYSLTNDSLTKFEFKNPAAAIRDSVINLFGEGYFGDNFEKKAIVFFKDANLELGNIKPYFEYIKSLVSQKELVNPRGYTYSLFFKSDILQAFLQQQVSKKQIQNNCSESEHTKAKLICPVCHKHFIPNHEKACPNCDFEIIDFDNQVAIKKQRQLYEMTKETLDSYLEELMSFKSELPMPKRIAYFASAEGKLERDKYMANVNQKYGTSV